jgi:outer membrane murein-binding lipoprotein Lpp
MKRMVVGTTLLTALLLAGCAPKYDPFRISADEFRRRVKTIAVAQVAVSPNVAESGASAKFHPAIESKLQAAGFTVVPSERVREVWDAKASELGGLFDQQTGALNEAKANALITHVRAQVKERFGADALVLPYVRRVTANFSSLPFAGIDAKWDGASESIVTSGVDKVLTPNVSGKVPALSLIVRIEDLAGAILYSNAGGIQVVEKLKPGGGQFSREAFVAVPRSEIFADPQRIQQAVNYALDPFFKRD